MPAGDEGRDDERDLVGLADDDPLDVREEPPRRVGRGGRVLGRLRASRLHHFEAKV